MWTFARDVSAHTGLLCSGSDPRSTDGQRAEDRPGPRPASLPSPSPGHAIGDHRRSAPRMTGEESAGRRRSHSANIKQIARDCDTGPGQSIKFAGDINAGVNLIAAAAKLAFTESAINLWEGEERLKSLVLATSSR